MKPPAQAPSEAARSLLAASPAIDLHADTLMWARWVGYDLRAEHTPPLPFAALGGHVDIPRMRKGGMGGQFFGLVSLPLPGASRDLASVVHAQIDLLDRLASESEGLLRKVTTADELEACRRDGVCGALLGVEGAHALGGDLSKIDAFAARGVRYLGLAHLSANGACRPAYGVGKRKSEGLSAFGHAVVERCEAAGLLVDLAHVNRRGFMEACEAARGPVIVSHTGAAGAFAHCRNIDDNQIRAVAAKGGVVGVIFCPKFLGGNGLGPVIHHLQQVIAAGGEDAPALGSDWDGFILPTRELADPTGIPLLVQAMLEAGLTDRVIGKILRGNVLRVLSAP